MVLADLDTSGGASTREHPAPFPKEFALRLIRMFSFAGDLCFIRLPVLQRRTLPPSRRAATRSALRSNRDTRPHRESGSRRCHSTDRPYTSWARRHRRLPRRRRPPRRSTAGHTARDSINHPNHPTNCLPVSSVSFAVVGNLIAVLGRGEHRASGVVKPRRWSARIGCQAESRTARSSALEERGNAEQRFERVVSRRRSALTATGSRPRSRGTLGPPRPRAHEKVDGVTDRLLESVVRVVALIEPHPHLELHGTKELAILYDEQVPFLRQDEVTVQHGV